VGRILNENKDSRSLGFVRTIESNRAAGHQVKRRLSEQGQVSDGVTVFTDGAPGLRCLLMSALPKATHILDWSHLTRRLKVLKRVLFGKEAINQFPTANAHSEQQLTASSSRLFLRFKVDDVGPTLSLFDDWRQHLRRYFPAAATIVGKHGNLLLVELDQGANMYAVLGWPHVHRDNLNIFSGFRRKLL